MLVHIIDLNTGNLQSIKNAAKYLGYKTQYIKGAEDFHLADIERLILPGVGNFGYFISKLRDSGLVEPLIAYIHSGKPLLGICVGLQVLFKLSEESIESKGLGIIDMELTKFNSSTKVVPHMGWNTVENKHEGEELFYGIEEVNRFYFVHSYAAMIGSDNILEDELISKGWMVATSTYGDEEFIAAIRRDNIFATQFHPEKSGVEGLQLIDNFLKQVHTLKVPTDMELPSVDTEFNRGLSCRIISCLDIRSNDEGKLVVTKGDQYDVRDSKDGNVRNVGDPIELARRYYEQGSDEIVFLNITSFRDCPINDQPMLNIIKQAAKQIFVPLTIGGGIKDIQLRDGSETIPAVDVAGLYFKHGADKVSIGSDAVIIAEKFYSANKRGDGSSAIETISRKFGSQAVVISIDPIRVYISSPSEIPFESIETKYPNSEGQTWCWYQCTIKGGRERRNIGVCEVVKACESLGAGEILLNCIDKDGTNAGYDLELLQHVRQNCKIPIIASSGAGQPQHFVDAFKTGVDACLGAGLFHRGDYSVEDVKKHLLSQKIKVRWPNA